MAIHRVTARWTGFQGAPGYTTFHFEPFTGGGDAGIERGRVRAFFAELDQLIGTGATITVLPTVEIIDETTGVLTGYIEDDTELAPVTAPTSGTSVGSAGAVINWQTSTVVNGRRLRGRTFIVPMRTVAFDTDGTLASNAITALNAAAEAITDSQFESNLVVWSRPSNGGGGTVGPVTGYRIPDMAAVLRSRRD